MAVFCCILAAEMMLGSLAASAQEPFVPLRPAEAFATRFSGLINDGGKAVIDPDGIVGSIIDLRNPRQSASGQHWESEPQRSFITAGEVGQVFGVALDNASPPNIYVTATSKFGLQLQQDDWMEGQWGATGGPGTIYILRAANQYRPVVFAEIILDGRRNTGAALGNIVFEKNTNQLFVSDLETGMIHRLDATSGRDLGHFDHGVEGRPQFLDAAGGAQAALPAVPFNRNSSANFTDCKAEFSATPDCWNFADRQRRVWGLGAFMNAQGQLRLYYGIWSAGFYGAGAYSEIDEGNSNSIWSIAIKRNGDFDRNSVRREIIVPTADDETGSGISDIAFSGDGEMLIAETGFIRNIGLERVDPFAEANQARIFTARAGVDGVWRLATRYSVGNFLSGNPASPLRISAAGGVDFGYGYSPSGTIDMNKPDGFVWMSGDDLCSADGPCLDVQSGAMENSDEVHGYQGSPRKLADQVQPVNPNIGNDPPDVVSSYLIDANINIDVNGLLIEVESRRNDGTKIGDIEIYKTTGKPHKAPPQRPLPPAQRPLPPVQSGGQLPPATDGPYTPPPVVRLPRDPNGGYDPERIPGNPDDTVPNGGNPRPPRQDRCHDARTTRWVPHLKIRSLQNRPCRPGRETGEPERPPAGDLCHRRLTTRMVPHRTFRSQMGKPCRPKPTGQPPANPPTGELCHQLLTTRMVPHQVRRSQNGRPCRPKPSGQPPANPPAPELCHKQLTSRMVPHSTRRSRKGKPCRPNLEPIPSNPSGGNGGVDNGQLCHQALTSRMVPHRTKRSRKGKPCRPWHSVIPGGLSPAEPGSTTPAGVPAGTQCHNKLTTIKYRHSARRSRLGKTCNPTGFQGLDPNAPVMQDPAVQTRPAPPVMQPGTRPGKPGTRPGTRPGKPGTRPGTRPGKPGTRNPSRRPGINRQQQQRQHQRRLLERHRQIELQRRAQQRNAQRAQQRRASQQRRQAQQRRASQQRRQAQQRRASQQRRQAQQRRASQQRRRVQQRQQRQRVIRRNRHSKTRSRLEEK